MRIGQGFDSHRLVEGRPLILAGERIPHSRGLEGHSDGDVVLHAVADAILGALGEGDLGGHFPSSDPALEGAASAQFVARAVELMDAGGWAIGNLDCTLIAEAPRLAPYQAAVLESDWRRAWAAMAGPFKEQRTAYRRIHGGVLCCIVLRRIVLRIIAL